MPGKTDTKDGFEVVRMDNDEVIDFIECTTHSEAMRERAMAGLLRNMDTDQYFVRDTRDDA